MAQRVQDQKPTREKAALDWIKSNVREQKTRYNAIVKEMEALTPKRKKWIKEFLKVIQTRGFNMDGDDKIVLDPSQLPVKPEGCEDLVVWKHGVDSDPAINDRD